MVFMFVFPFLPPCVACRILVPSPGIEPGPPQWKHQVLTPGPPGNSPIFMFDQYQHQLTRKSPVLVLTPHLHGGDLPCPLPAGQGGGRWWEPVKEKGKTGGEGAKRRLARGALLTSSSFCHNFYILLPFALGNRPAVGRSLFTCCLCCRLMVGKMMLRRLCEQKYCLWGLAAKAATTVLIPWKRRYPPTSPPPRGKVFFLIISPMPENVWGKWGSAAVGADTIREGGVDRRCLGTFPEVFRIDLVHAGALGLTCRLLWEVRWIS